MIKPSVLANKKLWLVGAVSSFLCAAAPYPEVGRALISADHVLASKAGRTAFEHGGNAIDAVVSAALAAGVVQPAGSGLGGGGFAVFGVAGDQTKVLDFREVAPAAATEKMFQDSDGAVVGDRSRIGPLAVAVPGESRGLARLLSEHGRLSSRQVATPAIEYAEKGFFVEPHLAAALLRNALPEVEALFSRGGSVVGVGSRIRRPYLAKTLRRWSRTGGEDLHVGLGAELIQNDVSVLGGVISSQDLAEYEPVERQVVRVRYGEFVIETMPLPSSGGVCLGQMLQVLDGMSLAEMGHNSSEYIHLLVETMKHAYADRAQHLGDPDFIEVDTERLLSQERVGEVREKFDPDRTHDSEYYGHLFQPPKDAGTQHISAIDAEGGAAALTTTINTSFGSGLVVEKTGLILNNEMDDFVAAPGVPNAFGLVGGSANAIAPRKRPLSSMSPTLVRNADGEIMMSIGASGGSMIISSVLQVFLNIVEFGMDPQEAVAAPRFHHQWQPDVILLEGGIPRDVTLALERRGHQTKQFELYSSVQVVRRVADGMEGGADPRKGGWPSGL